MVTNFFIVEPSSLEHFNFDTQVQIFACAKFVYMRNILANKVLK